MKIRIVATSMMISSKPIAANELSTFIATVIMSVATVVMPVTIDV
jgi:hypothetical protein